MLNISTFVLVVWLLGSTTPAPITIGTYFTYEKCQKAGERFKFDAMRDAGFSCVPIDL